MRAQARAQLQRSLAALAGGDRGAFDQVFELAWPVLRSLARSVLRDDTDAEDIAQRALLRLFAAASDFDPDRPALPWVVTFCVNEIRTTRSQQRRRNHGSVDPTWAARDDPEAEVLHADLRASLHDVLGSLAECDRVALGFDTPSGSGVEVAPAARRKRKQRALARLRAAWRRIHGPA